MLCVEFGWWFTMSCLRLAAAVKGSPSFSQNACFSRRSCFSQIAASVKVSPQSRAYLSQGRPNMIELISSGSPKRKLWVSRPILVWRLTYFLGSWFLLLQFHGILSLSQSENWQALSMPQTDSGSSWFTLRLDRPFRRKCFRSLTQLAEEKIDIYIYI